MIARKLKVTERLALCATFAFVAPCVTASAESQCSAPFNRTSFDGGDVATCTGSTVDECCSCCAETPLCNGYTLYNNVCYLKDVTSSQPSDCGICKSGRLKSNPPPSPSPSPHFQCATSDAHDYGPDSADNMVAMIPVADAEECCTICGEEPGCVSWTLYEGQCYLKDGFADSKPCSECVSGMAPHNSEGPLPPQWEIQGMTFTGGRYCPEVAFGTAASEESLRWLNTTGTNWVSIVTTWYQWNISSTEIFPLYNGSAVNDTTSHYYTFVTQTDDAVRAAIKYAHSLGMKVMLKPHIDLLRDNKPSGRFWRGDIGGCPAVDWNPPPQGVAQFTSRQWEAWFDSYSSFLQHYTKMAHDENVEMLSLNCELYCPNKEAERWRKIVKDVRNQYDGKLTVSQIAGHEHEMTWWDAVDVIGIDAYYKNTGTTVAEMVYGWGGPISIARALHSKYKKPVAYTEIGMCSGKCARTHTPSSVDYYHHAAQYQAVFEAFREESYFLGCFWWNWDTDPGTFSDDDCLTPQAKPAEDVLRKYYRATEPKGKPSERPALCVGDGKCTC